MSKEDIKEARIKTLTETQLARKQKTLDKVHLAIERLQKIGAKINFQTIAKEANVSVPYLYKYPELKAHIAQIRNQQSSMPTSPTVQPPVTAKTHSQIVERLKKRLSELEKENTELKRNNVALAGQVYRVHSLLEQVERQKQIIETLKNRLSEVTEQIPQAKVIPLTDKSKAQFSDSIKAQLEALGIPLNTTLTKTIKAAAREDIVLFAIKALREALERSNIENPGGWLNTAIKDGWMPSENYLPGYKAEREVFKEWFDLARKQRLVLAATKGDDGQMIVYTADGVPLPFKQMLAEYPLEKLRLLL